MKKPVIPLVLGVIGLLVVLAGIAFARLPGGQAATSPKLVVDREQIDFGRVPYNQPVTAVFRLSNEGDQALKIVGEPEVQVVKGC